MNFEFNETELRRVDLNLLLVFSALMRERSVSRAALRLRVGAPAISMAIGRLRRTFADDLFVRANASMEPTPAALRLWRRIEPALAGVEAAVRETRIFDPATSSAQLRLVLPDDLEFVILPLLLQRLSAQAPGIRLSVRPTDFRTLFGRLDDGDADLALVPQPRHGIERRHRLSSLYRDSPVVLFDRRTAKRFLPLTIETYLELPHIVVSPSGALTDGIDDHLAEIGRRRTVVAAVSHYPSLPFILKRRPAVAHVASVAAYYLAEAYGLALAAPPITLPHLDLALAWHVRTDADPANAWLRHLVSEIIDTLRTDAMKGLWDKYKHEAR